MTNTTDLELKVLEEIKSICEEDYSAIVSEIAENLSITNNQVKGVVSSLSKKNLVQCDMQERRGGKVFNDIFPLRKVEGKYEVLSFGEWD